MLSSIVHSYELFHMFNGLQREFLVGNTYLNLRQTRAIETIARGSQHDVTNVDLRKAFDPINHELSLYNL